jgi:endonuclease YncB( thermonuclease family)
MVYLKDSMLVDSNVSWLMVREGYACVYRGKGAEYSGIEGELDQAEKLARGEGLGIWSNCELK